jgi:hypothetical protein
MKSGQKLKTELFVKLIPSFYAKYLL